MATTEHDVVTQRVLNPVGYPPTVTARPMARRLDGLEGKRLFVIDPRFDDGTNLLMRLLEWFQQHLPEVQTEYVTLPGNYLQDHSKLWEELSERGDAAIIGVGHCSTCAPAVSQITMDLESRFQLPTVALHTQIFERVVRSVSQVGGMPEIRQVFVPHPVIGRAEDELRAYIEGNDPVTGMPVMQEVIEGLTAPVEDQGDSGRAFERSTPRFVEFDKCDDPESLFAANGWTDYLPIVLPTEERVEAMLAGTSRDRDDLVGELRPTFTREGWRSTVEKVAVNAVMAGARPEYFPVILALAASGVTARSSSTASPNAMAVINGPIRDEIGMNSGLGAMGPYSHPNATIGRAFGLLSQNLQGGSEPGVTFMGSQGNNLAYNSLCFAENEEASPWAPLHVDKGFESSASTVSVFRGAAYLSTTLAVRPDSWQEQLVSMLRGMDPGMCSPTLLLDPLAAELFARVGGFETKEDLISWVHTHALIQGGVYWDYQSIRNYLYPNAAAGKEPGASRLKAGPEAMLEIFAPEAVTVVVVGGSTKPYWSVAGARHHKTVSVDEWR